MREGGREGGRDGNLGAITPKERDEGREKMEGIYISEEPCE